MEETATQPPASSPLVRQRHQHQAQALPRKKIMLMRLLKLGDSIHNVPQLGTFIYESMVGNLPLPNFAQRKLSQK